MQQQTFFSQKENNLNTPMQNRVPKQLDFINVQTTPAAGSAKANSTNDAPITETNYKVAAGARWISGLNCKPEEPILLQEVLWNRPTSSPILRFDRKSIDVISFCDLAEKRYIDSFVTDVCISKYIEESTICGKEETMYFPTEFLQWMQVNDKAFKIRNLKARALQVARFDNLKQILVPVFIVNHWGLIYISI